MDYIVYPSLRCGTELEGLSMRYRGYQEGIQMDWILTLPVVLVGCIYCLRLCPALAAKAWFGLGICVGS